MKRIFRRSVAVLLCLLMLFGCSPLSYAAQSSISEEAGTIVISNDYLKVTINRENGGYVISTNEGDILKKTDNNMDLTHRGENMDTSFTSFRINGKDYIFGNRYGLFGSRTPNPVITQVNSTGDAVLSTWKLDSYVIEQAISLVNNDASDALGTALITYTVSNRSSKAVTVRSRMLMDTQLGSQDYGYYELPLQQAGQGYEYFESERTWDSEKDKTIKMPADYFVRNSLYSSELVAYGVNSVFESERPYKMTFAHWANIAATVFDYTPDPTLNFTNPVNSMKTADSAAALYYDLGTIAAQGEKSFSTYYGVTANLKNRDNQVLLNVTAPTTLEFSDSGKTAYRGSDGSANGLVRINVRVESPAASASAYKRLAIVAYTDGFTPMKRTDSGTLISYNNTTPISNEVTQLAPGENRETYFDFYCKPENQAQLGRFVIKVYDVDPAVNDLGSYAEEYCLASYESNFILPGVNSELPTITLAGSSPQVLYFSDVRFLTVIGQGMQFFQSSQLDKILLVGDAETYELPPENIIANQDDPQGAITIRIDQPMLAGRYQVHFIWKDDPDSASLCAFQDIPSDFTSPSLTVSMTSDERYANHRYGILTVQRDEENTYRIVGYDSEGELETALSSQKLKEEDLLLTFRGELVQDGNNKKMYRLQSKNADVTINGILNYHGSSMTLEEKDGGTVEVLMDGKITTIGSNTTVRSGTAAFRLKKGVDYIVPLYDSAGEVLENGELQGKQSFIELKWDNALDILTTVGGFLVNLKFGVIGKMQGEKDKDAGKDDPIPVSDIISFGGELDLSFLTPGGAAQNRANRNASTNWTVKDSAEEEYEDKYGDGITFGLEFDEESGMIKSQSNQADIPPKKKDAARVEFSAAIDNMLFGGFEPGFVGVNAAMHFNLPHMFGFLPENIQADAAINTIGYKNKQYSFSIEAGVDLANMGFNFALVVRSNEKGAPIPDKVYFAVNGFEPGFNVDSLGIFWVTGGGGGIENLYDTIYGFDGVPPLTLLLTVSFDITKIMTGTADLSLSLRGLSFNLHDVSLKMIKNAKFLDSGVLAVGWYPNFSFELSAKVNFIGVMKGMFSITAAAGKDVDDFFEFLLRVSFGLPNTIPIVGGMELATAELGGGTEKVWGSVCLLDMIKVGFIYYWGDGFEFVHGNDVVNLMGTDIFEPQAAGNGTYVAAGSNLTFFGSSKTVGDLNALRRRQESAAAALASSDPSVYSNANHTDHRVDLGASGDYLLMVSRTDGTPVTEAALKNAMRVSLNGSAYPLSYYVSPGEDATDAAKTEALRSANVNIAAGTGYIAVTAKKLSEGQLLDISFSDGNSYEISVLRAEPISSLTSVSSTLQGSTLNVSWIGENLTDSAEILVYASETAEERGLLLNQTHIPAKYKGSKGSAAIPVPDTLSSGQYSIKVVLSDENVCFEPHEAGTVTVTNAKAPNAAQSVTVKNAGSGKLEVLPKVSSSAKFDGYLLDVYADGELIDAGLYFGKDEQILIGGLYDMPVYDENGSPTGETVKVGYTAGKSYTVKLRTVNLEDPDKTVSGDEIYHSSATVGSDAVTLRAATPPKLLKTAYDAASGTLTLTADCAVTGELYVDGEPAAEFKKSARKQSKVLRLADGDHTLEVHLEDADGDRSIVTDLVSVDTTPPTLMLSNPVNGAYFTGSRLHIQGFTEPGAAVSYQINGKTAAAVDSPSKTDSVPGMIDCYLPIGAAGEDMTLRLTVTAADAAGNKTVETFSLANGDIANVNEIILMADGEVPAGRKISMQEGEELLFTVIGKTTTGKTLDLTGCEGVQFSVLSGTAAEMNGETVHAVQDGSALVRASFQLGGGQMLTDGVSVEVGKGDPNSSSNQGYTLTMNDQDTRVIVTLTNEQAQGTQVDLLAAAYNGAGKLLSVRMVTGSITANGLQVAMERESMTGVSQMRFFVLDPNAGTPLRREWVWKPNN